MVNGLTGSGFRTHRLGAVAALQVCSEVEDAIIDKEDSTAAQGQIRWVDQLAVA